MVRSDSIDYLDFIIKAVYKFLEEFFDNFTIVSGKAMIRAFMFSVVYLIISIISNIFEFFTFVNWKSALLSVVILAIINGTSYVQRKDIIKFKEYLRGDK